MCPVYAASSMMDIVSPFDLVVVPAEAAESHHWTMSVMGVVEIHSATDQGEFTTMGEWIR